MWLSKADISNCWSAVSITQTCGKRSRNNDMRKIIHIDADSFYASVEMRENPELRDKPIAVGGASGRGVIATANYAARGYGVRSALPTARARQLCPQLIIIKPRFDLYRTVSNQFREIFADFTESIEPLSLDEAYLDVSDSPHFGGSATLIAEEIRRRIREELALTVSAGVAPNKFLAKVASDLDKPDGLVLLGYEQLADLLWPLPIERLWGVGPKTATAIVAAIGDGSEFKNGRHLAAWVGLVPRQFSSGDRKVLMGISKRGNQHLRSLLVHGARAVVRTAPNKTDANNQWVNQLRERRGFNRATVAVANKNARIIWAVLRTGEPYRAAF